MLEKSFCMWFWVVVFWKDFCFVLNCDPDEWSNRGVVRVTPRLKFKMIISLTYYIYITISLDDMAVVSISECGLEGCRFKSQQHCGIFQPRPRLLPRARGPMGPVGWNHTAKVYLL